MFDLPFGGLLGLIVLFLDIYAIIKVAQSSASAGMKALWIVIIVFLPVLGLILWFLLGPKG
ncbi:MAG: PLDc_N domain-containing protein [Halothiobacillaceae bacterium]|nr:PLDc_N domain-containing protein [Halothiobacillaceae bacterium]HER35500.1 PLDc_N domain-containing protein [Halothiobacillaceae bacterium]